MLPVCLVLSAFFVEAEAAAAPATPPAAPAATVLPILQEQALLLVAHALGQLLLSLIRCLVAPVSVFPACPVHYLQSDVADSVFLIVAAAIPIFYPRFHVLKWIAFPVSGS